MSKIYVIVFNNGEEYEDLHITNYGYTDDEEKAKELIEKLNKRFMDDTERYRYLKNHKDLLLNEDGEYRDNEYVKEYFDLSNKYPYYFIDDCCDMEEAGFDYEELTKIELD